MLKYACSQQCVNYLKPIVIHFRFHATLDRFRIETPPVNQNNFSLWRLIDVWKHSEERANEQK